jgi:hypothetical protein
MSLREYHVFVDVSRARIIWSFHVMDHTTLVTSIKKPERSVLFEHDVSKTNKQAIAPSTISSKILPTPLMLEDTMFSKEKLHLRMAGPLCHPSSLLGLREDTERRGRWATRWRSGVGGSEAMVVPLWPGDEPPTSLFLCFFRILCFHNWDDKWDPFHINKLAQTNGPYLSAFLVSIQNQLTIIVFCKKKLQICGGFLSRKPEVILFDYFDVKSEGLMLPIQNLGRG